MKNQFLTVAETAKILRLSTRRVQELAQAGRLDAMKPFGRILIKRKSVAQKLGMREEEL